MVRNEQNENIKNVGDAEERLVSDKVLHHAMNPVYLGEMDKPDGQAVITGPCGDTDEFPYESSAAGSGRSVSGQADVFSRSLPATPWPPWRMAGRSARQCKLLKRPFLNTSEGFPTIISTVRFLQRIPCTRH